MYMKNIITTILSKLYSMASSSGGVSLTRIVAFLTAIDILLVYTAQNIVAMVNSCSYADFPANTVMVLLVVMGAKVAQKPFEKHESVDKVEENNEVKNNNENP
jgi:hypothetical protein